MKTDFDLPGNPKYESVLPSDVRANLKWKIPAPPACFNLENFYELRGTNIRLAQEIKELKEAKKLADQAITFLMIVLAIGLIIFLRGPWAP